MRPQLATASQGGPKQRTTTAAGKPLNGVQVGVAGHLSIRRMRGLTCEPSNLNPFKLNLPCTLALCILGFHVTRF